MEDAKSRFYFTFLKVKYIKNIFLKFYIKKITKLRELQNFE